MGLFNRKKKPKKSTNEIIRETIDKEKTKMLNKGRTDIQIPYTKSGVNDALLASQILGKGGAVLGSLNEGDISWKHTKLLFKTEGIYIKANGAVVFYDDINSVILGDKSFIYTMMTIVTDSGNNLVLRGSHYIIQALKEIIESHITEKEDNNTGSPDDLLKYADLLEKGLITEEEFIEFKNRLLK